MEDSNNLNIVGIIPARGGSKGIPNKNIIDICGHPLISWSINQSISANSITSTWVTSDDIKILDFLLWKWKSELSREWYPFLFGLKQDLQINQKLITSGRMIKNQTIPLSEFLNKGALK